MIQFRLLLDTSIGSKAFQGAVFIVIHCLMQKYGPAGTLLQELSNVSRHACCALLVADSCLFMRLVDFTNYR